MLTAVIFLSLPTINAEKSVTYFLSNGMSTKSGRVLDPGIAATWKKAVPIALSKFWEELAQGYAPFLENVNNTKFRRELEKVLHEMPGHHLVEYDSRLEDNTALAIGFSFDTRKIEIDSQPSITAAVKSALEAKFSEEKEKGHSGWIELALEAFAKSRLPGNWLGVGCVLEGPDDVDGGNIITSAICRLGHTGPNHTKLSDVELSSQ